MIDGSAYPLVKPPTSFSIYLTVIGQIINYQVEGLLCE